MITAEDFRRIRAVLGQQAEDDIAWAQSCAAPATAEDFALETIFVICNSGMKFTVAQGIFNRVLAALEAGKPVRSAFGHPGKARAIELIWTERAARWRAYLDTRESKKLEYLAALPWIGEITKFHLAKNFGLPYAKPDVHMHRLAAHEGCEAQHLCERLAYSTGLSVGAVDTVLWRACATGVIDSRTGKFRSDAMSQPRTGAQSLPHPNL